MEPHSECKWVMPREDSLNIEVSHCNKEFSSPFSIFSILLMIHILTFNELFFFGWADFILNWGVKPARPPFIGEGFAPTPHLNLT